MRNNVRVFDFTKEDQQQQEAQRQTAIAERLEQIQASFEDLNCILMGVLTKQIVHKL